jgi:hypothetical protein
MRRVSRLAFVGWFMVSAGGCAAVTGLDSIQEQDCAPNCGTDAQATHDVTVPDQSTGDDAPTADRSTGDDAATESSVPEGSSSGGPETSTVDAPHDAPGAETGKDGGGDTGTDAPPDAPKDTGTVDTGTDTGTVDSGCGATNTLQNCGACGQSCSAGGTNGVNTNGAGCTGTTCLYQCSTGHLDCNASVGYDGDGCECDTSLASTAACCGTACPIAHITGQNLPGGQSTNFYDCTPAGTFTSQLATDACAAYFGTSQDCGAPGECTSVANDAGSGDFVVCGAVTPNVTECVCWEYQGPNVGKVMTATGAFLGQCYCPGSTGTGLTQYSWH